MIVELVGLPGSGKTTYARLLAERGFTVVAPPSRGVIVWENILFALRHPVQFSVTLLFLLEHLGSRQRWKLKVMNLFFVHNAKYRIARRLPRAVLDQGHLQNVLSLFDRAVPRSVIQNYLSILPLPDKIVLLDCPHAVRVERMTTRGYSVRPEESADDRKAFLAAAEENFDTLKTLLSDNIVPVPVHVGTDKEYPDPTTLSQPVWYMVMNARMPTEKAHGLQIAKSCEALQKIGCDVVLVIPHRPGSDPQAIPAYYALTIPFTVRSLWTVGWGWIPWSRLRYPLQSLSFFVVLQCLWLDREGIYYTRSPLAALILKMRGVRTAVLEAHSLPGRGRMILRSILRRIDLLVANAEGTAAAYRALAPIPILVAPNGADLSLFAVDPGRAASRKKVDLPEDKRVVLYAGAFYDWKGVPFLLDAWKARFSRRTDVLLVLVGGKLNDVPHNVRVIDHVPHTRIPTYLFSADILVLPTIPTTEEARVYTSPIKLAEYMAAGRPILASDLPSTRALVSADDVVFFRAGDADDLERHLSDLLAQVEHEWRPSRVNNKLCDWTTRARMIKEKVENIRHD